MSTHHLGSVTEQILTQLICSGAGGQVDKTPGCCCWSLDHILRSKRTTHTPPPLGLPAAMSLGPKHEIPGRENVLVQLECVSRPRSETVVWQGLTAWACPPSLRTRNVIRRVKRRHTCARAKGWKPHLEGEVIRYSPMTSPSTSSVRWATSPFLFPPRDLYQQPGY